MLNWIPTKVTAHPPKGFTLMELMVAISIAGLMVTLINFTFQDTTKAVKRGLAIADVVNSTRSANDLIVNDFEQMVGPQDDTDPSTTIAENDGGVFAIVQHTIDATVLIPPDGAEKPQRVRSDQLMFFRSRENADGSMLMPVMPETVTSFGNDFRDAARDEFDAEHVKVWYGHVLPTDEYGVSSAATTSTPTDPLGSGSNAIVNFWSLGRHAIFMVDDDGTTDKPTMSSSHIRSQRLSSSDITAASHNGDVLGYGTATTPDTDIIPHKVFSGLSESAAQVLGGVGVTSGVGSSISPSVIDDLVNLPVYVDYYEALLSYTYASQRLRANPDPILDIEPSASPTLTWYRMQAWQVAQTRPVFMNGVADFIVEFAGDYFNNAALTVNTDFSAAPYDAYDPLEPDSLIDRHGGFTQGVANGSPGTIGNVDNNYLTYDAISPGIKWYTSETYANFPSGPNGYDSTKPLTFAAPWQTGTSRFPPLRDTAELDSYTTDAIGPSVNRGGNATNAFLWRHDDESGTTFESTPVNNNGTGSELDTNLNQSSLWPYLIRIRYRMLDNTGQIDSGINGEWVKRVIEAAADNGLPIPIADDVRANLSLGGIWFEQVFKVNRP